MQSFRKFTAVIMFLLCSLGGGAQDTFSILAFDSITGEVGGAGASCVDLFNFPGYANDFIIELFPGEGGIATQAAYHPSNQTNARNMFINGLTPDSLIKWLEVNDALGNSSNRQYGVVKMVTGASRSAAFTGTACINYKNHITGPNYSIQGNILLGQKVLDSMEARFLREPGDLACKLMAALQGAKMVGADTRCATNNSSSLFAFIKVSQSWDTLFDPSFILSLKTHSMDMVEPIDSLQKMFDAVKSCTVNTTEISEQEAFWRISVFPNPSTGEFVLRTYDNPQDALCVVTDVYGRTVQEFSFKGTKTLPASNWPRGVYFVTVYGAQGPVTRRIVLN